MNILYRNPKTPAFRTQRAQAIVEFALVLPILMMLLVGIFEVGRMIFTYAAVNNASREAARFGSALGFDDDGFHKYKHCEGIRNMARRSAFFLGLTNADITIAYDRGPAFSATPFAYCNAATGEDNGFVLTTNDRIRVTVVGSYTPLIKLIPLPPRTFTSTSARTILGFVEVGEAPPSGSGSGYSYTSTPTSAGTSTATATATITDTPTKTATFSPLEPTFTPLPSSTPSDTPTPTASPTMTFTPTMTSTPTSTPTAASSCSTITANVSVNNNTKVISMTITDPYVDVAVSSITLAWNKDGAFANKPGDPTTLTLDSANLASVYGTTYWSSLNNSTGAATLSPSSTLTIPGNNRQSILTFTFLQNYKATNMTGKTTITIYFSTPDCTSITKTY